jgi:DNA-binding transcriptional MocR family regulator
VASQANLNQSERVAAALTGWAGHGHGTLAQRLAHALRRAVAAGTITGGTRLPPERRLAEALAVSRSTITAALDELRSEGLVASRQGSGTVVVGPDAPGTPGTRIADHFGGTGGIDLAAGNPPDPSHLPPVALDVAALIAGGEGPAVQPLGLAALRTALAQRHGAAGRLTDPEQIHVTGGAHQAISLLVGAVAGRGATVALEDHGYPGIFDIIENLGARPAVVAADSGGMLPDALERVLVEQRPAAVYVQAGPHNPLGRVPGPGRLRALAAVLDEHPGTLVVEDTTLADLAFAGRVVAELADLCRTATVATAGSFSKVAWAGLRVGWLRAPAPLVERTMVLRLATDLGPSVPAQLLALQLLPHLDEIAAGRREVLAAGAAVGAAAVRRELPDWTVDDPAGGSVLWPRTPTPDTGPLVQLAARHGVHVAPGAIATVERAPSAHVRLCVDRPPEVIEEGIRRLAAAWRELQPRAAHVSG